MKRNLTMTLVVILLLSSVPTMAAPASVGPVDTGSEAAADGWYTDWFRDSDHDGIDDLLQDGARGRVDLFVDFTRPVGERDLERLRPFGAIAYVDPYIHVVVLDDVARSDLPRLAAVPGVVMVEKEPLLYPTLEYSAPAIRANSSSMYSNGARDLGYDGTGSVIAIFDTGVDNVLHEFLDDLDDQAGTNDPKYVAGIDATPAVGYIEDDPEDVDGHGTHVAGIAMGTGGSSKQLVGIAPQARLVDVKVLPLFGPGPGRDFLEGLAWCTANQDNYNISILSMSLGTQGASDGNDSLSRAVNEAVRINGFIVVAAMGNDGPDNVGIPAPAAADEAIAVGAIDDMDTLSRADDNLASLSNRGPRGSDGDSDQLDELKPDVSAPGIGIWSAQANTPAAITSKTGTSQATPHVSGTIALMLDANPDLTPRDVKRILRDTAQARGSPYDTGLDPKYNEGYGWGMVDAYGAVKRAEDLYTGGALAGPAGVSSGTSGTFTANFKFTRTEFQTTADNATLNISVPREWGKPSDISVSSEDGVTYTSGHTDPVQGAQNWTFSAWARFTGAVTSPKGLTATVTFSTFAPMDTGGHRFYMHPSINGVEGTGTDLNVQVVPGTGGEVDLLIAPSDITFSTEAPIAGQPVTISGVVHNTGTVGANANVSFFDGPPQTGVLIGIDTVSVPAGGTDSATDIWFASPGTHSIHVVIDILNIVAETNENNNMANKTIFVTGINNPPTAALSVNPQKAGVGMPVIFDGSNSSDVDGVIVLYNYDFGDGNTSGWIPLAQFTYTYSAPGTYTTTLTVQDNGGAQSTNEPHVLVDVQSTTTKTRTMYMYSGYKLLFTEPDEADHSSTPVPNGFTPFTPGSPFGTVETQEVDTWYSNVFQKNMTVSGTITFHLWMNNSGTNDIEVSNVTFNLQLDDETFLTVEYPAFYIRPGIAVEVQTYTVVDEFQIDKYQVLSLNIWAALDGDYATIEYASVDRDSGIDLTLTSFQGVPPVVDAGDAVTARVNTTVEFTPVATDEDGSIIKYEWDFDDDGSWDFMSSDTGATTYTYTVPGEYNATVMVTDNDGDTASDGVNVTILPPNRRPVITNPTPKTPFTMDAGESQAFSVDISDPDGDELTVKWRFDGIKRVTEGAIFTYYSKDEDVGQHEVMVEVSDAEDMTTYEWKVTVVAVNHAPVIESVSPSTSILTLYEEDIQAFSVKAEDDDGDDLDTRWVLDGVTSGTGTTFTYYADREEIGTHYLFVEVTDGEYTDSRNWTITVESLNNDPVIRFTTPTDGQRFRANRDIVFNVDVDDPDGDTLSFTWESSLEGQLSRQQSFTARLTKGDHVITVTVDDGRGGVVTDTVNIVVLKAKEKVEDYSGTIAGALLLVVIGVVGFLVWFFMFHRPAKLAAAHRAAYEAERRKQAAAAAARRRKKGGGKGGKARAKGRGKGRGGRRPARDRETVMEHAIDDERKELDELFGVGGGVGAKADAVALPRQAKRVRPKMKRVVKRRKLE